MRLITLFILLSNICFSQGQFNNWFFGSGAGLTFSSGSPVALTNGQTNTIEGVATMSDASGNLLFYTDGITVYNSTHTIMANGTGLLGNSSSTQSAIIIEWPLDNDKYFIFTSAQSATIDGICYSVVDMSLGGGLGAVTIKNVQIQTPSCEKLCAVRHCNNQDIWIISHDWLSNVYRTWLVTPLGVNTTPVLSATGWTVINPVQSSYGQLKANLQGNKLANAYYGSGNRIEVGDFNNITGVVSNMQLIGSETGAYGCEFSPDGKVVYCSTNQGRLTQYNLCAGNNVQIVASRYLVASTGAFMGSLQIGPDNKIYLARNTSALSVINNPNVLGVGCGYSDLSISLLGKNGRFCLPNFASFYNRPRDDYIYTTNCLSVNFFAPILSTGSCSLTSPILSYHWYFGDGQESQNANTSHTYATPGSYTATLELQFACYTEIITHIINITGNSLPITTFVTQP